VVDVSELRWEALDIVQRCQPAQNTWPEVLHDLHWNDGWRIEAIRNDILARGACTIPIRVTSTESGFRVVDGHRRVAAALSLLVDVPVEIVNGDTE